MSTIISLASQKGGVAKSASAVNLAMGLAHEGNKDHTFDARMALTTLTGSLIALRFILKETRRRSISITRIRP